MIALPTGTRIWIAAGVTSHGSKGVSLRYIVCYDVMDDLRRQRLADVLLDYGTRVEESVFECLLEPALAEQMTNRIGRVLDTDKDKALVYGLCDSCAGKASAFGPVERPEQAEFYIL